MHEFDKKEIADNLYQHVDHLSVKIGDRHLWKENSLDLAAEYIESVLRSSNYSVSRQTFTSYGQSVSNLIVEKPGTQDGLIVIGAHYDTVPGSPGADDNASAVAGLLELARLFRDSPDKKRIVFAAFVNEESPCFGSYNMGSMVYARSLKEKSIPVEVMISLEMIGYFRKDEEQEYPFPGMDLFYPKTADFLAVAGNIESAKYVSFFKKNIRRSSEINVRSLIVPEQVALATSRKIDGGIAR